MISLEFLTMFVLMLSCIKSETDDLQMQNKEGPIINIYKNNTDSTEIINKIMDGVSHTMEEINWKTNEIKQQLDENFKNILNKFDENLGNLNCNKNFVQNKPKILHDEHFNCLDYCSTEFLPSDCNDAIPREAALRGIYKLYIPNSDLKPFYTNCERRDNINWTVIQRRADNSVDFFRNWSDYKNGFGDLNSEYWLGLERLHHLTQKHPYELYIRLKDENGYERFARYKNFSIANEKEKYKLNIDGYSGNAGDSLKRHNGKKFSTFDNHNDDRVTENLTCEDKYKGAWWFDRCFKSHLNGPFIGIFSRVDSKIAGIAWLSFDWHLKFSEMMIHRLSDSYN